MARVLALLGLSAALAAADLTYILAKDTLNLTSTVDFTVHQLPSCGSSVIVCENACPPQGESMLTTDLPVFTITVPLDDYFQIKQELAALKGQLLFSQQGAGEYFLQVVLVVAVPTMRTLDDLSETKFDRELLGFEPLSATILPDIKMPEGPLTDAEKDILDRIIAGLTTADFMGRLRQLSGEDPITVDGVERVTRTRSTHAEPHRWASNWAASFFRSLGYSVTQQPFNVGSSATNNVIAVKRGTTTPDRVFVIGAHYDSTSQSPATLAPGAVDNGSGAAAVMIAARAFAAHSFPSTIHFVLFGGEEQGLVGSTNYVNVARRDNVNVQSALIMDMIAYSNRFYGVIIEGTRNAAISALMDRYEAALRRWSPRLSITKSYTSFGSDHVPFQRAGIPAFLAIEADDTNYPHYHRSTDTVQWANSDQSVDILKGLAALLYAQASA